MPAAIGERTLFWPQANSTDCGLRRRGPTTRVPRMLLKTNALGARTKLNNVAMKALHVVPYQPGPFANPGDARFVARYYEGKITQLPIIRTATQWRPFDP